MAEKNTKKSDQIKQPDKKPRDPKVAIMKLEDGKSLPRPKTRSRRK